MAATAQVAVPQVDLPGTGRRAGFGGALRSELTKVRSVRSTYWTLLALVVVTIGISALFSWGHVQQIQHQPAALRAHITARDLTRSAFFSLFGLVLGQMIISVLGALTITSEYSTGMIRTSLTVMPRRGITYVAKAAVFAAVALVLGLLTSFASFFIGQAILSGQHLNTTLGTSGVLRQVVGAGLYLAACGMLAYGIGAMLRHTAGAITSAIGLLFVVEILSNFLPSNWAVHVDKWIPFNAGGAIWESATTQTNMFSPWVGFGVFCGYAAIALIGGFIVFQKRDA